MRSRSASVIFAALLLFLPTFAQVPQLNSPEEDAILDNGCLDGSNNPVWEFSWTPVEGANRYHLFVQRLGSRIPVLNHSIETTSFKHDQPGYITPPNADGWTWRVRAMVNGRWSKWSSVRSFMVEPVDTDCPKPVS